MTNTTPWRSAWIVGASTGIGKDLALLLASEGVATTITARTAPALSALASESPLLTPAAGDVTSEVGMTELFQDISSRAGVPDLVVLNAALWDPMSVDDYSAVRAIKSMQVNYGGVCNALAAIIPTMKASGKGHIAIVASVAGYRGLSKALAYAPTKAALINLSEALNLELHGSGVKVSVINPGFVDTPMTARNNFPMPFIVSSKVAAGAIFKGLKKGQFEIAFPWRFVAILKLLRILPYSLFFPIARRVLGL